MNGETAEAMLALPLRCSFRLDALKTFALRLLGSTCSHYELLKYMDALCVPFVSLSETHEPWQDSELLIEHCHARPGASFFERKLHCMHPFAINMHANASAHQSVVQFATCLCPRQRWHMVHNILASLHNCKTFTCHAVARRMLQRPCPSLCAVPRVKQAETSTFTRTLSNTVADTGGAAACSTKAGQKHMQPQSEDGFLRDCFLSFCFRLLSMRLALACTACHGQLVLL